MAFELPKLTYAYDALEPHIDARTMEIHHGKHHNGYTTNLNNAISGSGLDGQSIELILESLDMNNAAVRNNGGGFYNHRLFWSVMSPNGGGEPTGALSSFQHVGSRLSLGGPKLEAYTLIDFKINHIFRNQRLSVFFIVANVLDTEFVEIENYSTQGRSFRLGLNFSF